MAYEIYTPQGTAVGASASPAMRVGRGRMILNKAATHILVDAKVKTVLLLWDKENHRVAIRRAEPGHVQALSVAFHPDNNQCEISAMGFLRYIGWPETTPTARFPITWNAKEKMFEANIPIVPPGAVISGPDLPPRKKAKK